ncbi:hypothetical protein DICVIV_06401 [Dictyocaulus viviparus]|uniref:Uncharacterized protein n=1 Tax=Dictyocaulus viviparus TaxID=29172 RepID=A0A0D8XUS5_DICVI|nr:hypothetical protein DICVIV_06401 [Dictyocaulus viviparus]
MLLIIQERFHFDKRKKKPSSRSQHNNNGVSLSMKQLLLEEILTYYLSTSTGSSLSSYTLLSSLPFIR